MQAVLGRKGDYSVRAMLHLARNAEEGRQKARVVAADMEIPDGYATQILAAAGQRSVSIGWEFLAASSVRLPARRRPQRAAGAARRTAPPGRRR